MRKLVLILSGTIVVLLIAIVAVLAVLSGRGDGVDEEAYRQQVRPLILQWQSSIGLSTFICGDGEEGEDIAALAGTVRALTEIHRDVQALETPKRYQPGVEA